MRIWVAALAALALAFSPATAKERIAPQSESQLEQRVALFQQEARLDSCDVQDRLCAMGRYKFALAALELAQNYPDCHDQACAARKQARHAVAGEWFKAITVQTAAARGTDVYIETVTSQAAPDAGRVSAYVQQIEQALATSSCPESARACAAGRLVYVVEIDQLMRFGVTACESGPAASREACMTEAWKQTAAVDALARSTLDGITNRFGWPDTVHWGRELAFDAWLLAQHADEDQVLQVKFFKLIKASFEAGYTPAESYAYIADRRAMHLNRPQLYGTQGKCVGEGGTRHWEPNTIANAGHLDARRSEAGMIPFADYRKMTDQMCHGKL